MIERSDKWTKEHDEFLKETVLSHLKEGKTQMFAFEAAADELQRTKAACQFRFNSTLRPHLKDEMEQIKQNNLKQQKEKTTIKDLTVTQQAPQESQLQLESSKQISLETVLEDLKYLVSREKKLEEENERLLNENKQLKNLINKLESTFQGIKNLV